MQVRPAGGRWMPALLCALFRIWSATWRVRVCGKEILEQGMSEGAVFAFWHGEQLAHIFTHQDRGVWAMVSQSRDGELLAQVLARLGYRLLRGSSSRGGPQARRDAMSALEGGASVALAVDGPRGPRHVPHRGAVLLALGAGRALICARAHARPVWRMRSWDRFEIPLPFARVELRYQRLALSGDHDEDLASLTTTLAQL